MIFLNKQSSFFFSWISHLLCGRRCVNILVHYFWPLNKTSISKQALSYFTKGNRSIYELRKKLFICCYLHSLYETEVSIFSSFQSLTHVQLFGTSWIAACQASLSITNSWSSLRLTSIESQYYISQILPSRQ